MKKIIISLSVIAAVAAVAIGASTAFFSDTETSTGNTFTAGAIDLGNDNTSYYNGQPNPGTSWQLSYDMDLCTVPNPAYNPTGNPAVDPEGDPATLPCMFFNFNDLKPGDWGEDTISLHVNNNDSWLCADVTLTSNDDNGLTEPEGDDNDADDGPWNGELANAISWYWWGDDGDNVFEDNERLLPGSGFTFGEPVATTTYYVALADSQTNIWVNATGTPLRGDDTRYVGKAWCFGNSTFAPYPQGTTGPDERPVLCDGSRVNNVTQTDSLTADISFRAVQSRNNGNFQCSTPTG